MSQTVFDHILICGRGLAFEMTLSALANAMPDTIKITAIEATNVSNCDAFYGNTLSPLAYKLLLTLGSDEPEILRNSNTVFSYGTRYANWADRLNWAQSYNLPFPIWNNVQFHHYLVRLGETLEPYLVGASAGNAGVFAHPPSDPKIPLSRAEYGYQFCPASLAEMLKTKSDNSRVTRESGEVAAVKTNDGLIESVALADGHAFEAHLFIDTTGPEALLLSALDGQFQPERTLQFLESRTEHSGPISPLRQITGTEYGWTSATDLQDAVCHLSAFHPDSATQARAAYPGTQCDEITMKLGSRDNGWIGNCVGIGHASTVLEPLSTAPALLLQLDIERLLNLIPVGMEMSIEAREFNRLLADDAAHCALFNRAFFAVDDAPKSPYWQAVQAEPVPDKLHRKITQFESRGFMTAYDLEPFNEQDWMILHFGMGRRPRRYDVFIYNVGTAPIRQQMDQLRKSIEQIVPKIPPHRRYLDNFLNYLERKHGP